MISLPNIDYGLSPNPTFQNRISIIDELVPSAAMTMLSLATAIVRFLDKLGSGITLFGFSTEYLPKARPRKDTNGHLWPRYFYTRGRTIDAMGAGRVAAVPLPAAGLPEDSLFSRSYAKYLGFEAVCLGLRRVDWIGR